jgi:lysophospholipase L1-like esterase
MAVTKVALFGDSLIGWTLDDFNQVSIADGFEYYPIQTDLTTDETRTIIDVMGGKSIPTYDTKAIDICAIFTFYQCIEDVVASHDPDYLVFMVQGNDMRTLMDEDPKIYYGFTTEADVDVYITKYLAFVELFQTDFPDIQLIVSYYYPWTTTTEEPTVYTYPEAYGPVGFEKVNCTDRVTCTAATNTNIGYVIRTITPQLNAMGIPVIDMFNETIYSWANTDSWLWGISMDGVHPSPSGIPIFFDIFQNHILETIDDLMFTVQ